MKTPEELDALTRELEALNKKLAELNEEELEQVSGGLIPIPYIYGSNNPGDSGRTLQSHRDGSV